MIGKTASHYRILDRLGGGGMGEVFLAKETRLHRRVALKMLRDRGPDDVPAARGSCARRAWHPGSTTPASR